jgi:uncharacterized protein
MSFVETLWILFIVGLAAGIVDAVAGGGGLITFPVLLLAGLSPPQALATNKIQALTSVASSAYRYIRLGVGDRRTIPAKAIASAIGAAMGAVVVRILDPNLIARIAPLTLIGISVFFLFSPRIHQRAHKRLLSENTFALAAALPIGFYDGFFGPGTGSLYAAAFVILLGRDLVSATADTKVLNAIGSLVAAVIFLSGGMIVWSAAIAMSAGGILGGQIGAHLAVRWGAQFIRIGLVVVSITLAIRLLVQHL